MGFLMGSEFKPSAAPAYQRSPLLDTVQSKIDAIGNMSAPQKMALGGSDQAYQAKDMSQTAMPQYDAMRSRMQQQSAAQNQTAQDQTARRFSAMGNMNSGAYAKAAQLADQSSAENASNNMFAINAQEGQTRTALQQQEGQKAFQSGEALLGRNFQTNLYNNQSQNEFNRWQAQAGLQGAQTMAQLDAQGRAANQEEAATQFNKELEMYKAKHSGGLFGAGGFLGTGVGA